MEKLNLRLEGESKLFSTDGTKKSQNDNNFLPITKMDHNAEWKKVFLS